MIKVQKYWEIYADILLEDCLKIKKDEPLFIDAPIECYEFLRILVDKAYKLGVKDINLSVSDAYLKHSELQNLSLENLKQSGHWSGKVMDEYAKKNAAFLILKTEYPGLMSDIDPNILAELQLKITKESATFDEKRGKNELSWAIAAVATQDWADKVFPNEENNLTKLWQTIFDICLIKQEKPHQALKDKIAKSKKRAEKLNNLHLKTLKYQNSLGTDFTIDLPENYLFHNAELKLQDQRVVYVNIPSEEIYTSPSKFSAQGIVYASKPLIYNGQLIEDFYLEFKDGKVVDYHAKKGQKALENIINFDENSCYLGEVALVDMNSKIAATNLLFYTTLFDENASCHLALGQAFSDCILNGENMPLEKLESCGLNQSKAHVDFMIGTKDLKIIGIDYQGREIDIFKDGNCVL